MSTQLNSVTFIGRAVKDPEYRQVGETGVATVRAAINTTLYKKGGENKEETAYIDVEVWHRTAEVVRDNIKKGDPFLGIGRLVTDSWETDGQKKSKLKIVLDKFQFMPSGQGTRSESETVSASSSTGLNL